MKKIRAGDAVAYTQLLNFLMKCQKLDRLSSGTNPMDSPDIICMILAKVPVHLQNRWNRSVQKIRKTQMREPGFIDLTSFIENNMNLVNDPLFSKETVGQYNEKPIKPIRQKFHTYAFTGYHIQMSHF